MAYSKEILGSKKEKSHDWKKREKLQLGQKDKKYDIDIPKKDSIYLEFFL